MKEIADFHPETGHLHTCADRATCDCAAHLFCLAEDGVLQRMAKWHERLADRVTTVTSRTIHLLIADAARQFIKIDREDR